MSFRLEETAPIPITPSVEAALSELGLARTNDEDCAEAVEPGEGWC